MSNNLEKARKSFLNRWIFTSSVTSNYERMQALAYCFAILPLLKVIYKDNEDDLQQAVENHLQFFNTNPWIAPYIMGVNAAIEEKEKIKAKDIVANIKTGLMGPIAGLGDSLCVVIPWTIFGAIAANMALNNNPFGIVLWIIVSIIIKMLSFPLYKAGYVSGINLVKSLEKKMKIISESVSILGLMVVGGLIPTVIRAKVGITFTQGDVVMKGQEILDSILPGMIPVLLCGMVYYLLSKKTKPISIILLVLVLSIILGYFNILI